MLKHFITLAFRNLWRKKFHSAINIIGLAVGISACLVIYLIVNFELRFNKGIATPLSNYLLNQWLTNFTYHTNIDIFTYGLSFFLVLLIVSLTISYQAIRAAQANPVKSLSSE